MTLLNLAFRRQFHQFLRHIFDSGLCPGLRLLPVSAGQFVQPRCSSARTDILLNQIHLFHWHIEKIVPRILYLQIILPVALYLQRFDSHETADTVVFMNHIISILKIGKQIDRLRLFFLFGRFFLDDLKISLSEIKALSGFRKQKAPGQNAADVRQNTGPRTDLHSLGELRGDSAFAHR